MFIAKFQQTSDAPFKMDKNQNYPYIGTVMAGVATGTLINGTIFEREGLEANKLYACENRVTNWVDPNTGETKPQVEVVVIGAVSLLDYPALRKTLGEGRLLRQQVDESIEADDSVSKLIP